MGRITFVLAICYFGEISALSAQAGKDNNATPQPKESNCGAGYGAPCGPVEMADSITPLENEQADITLNLAHSLAREKRVREALETYQEFVRLYPMSPRLREARESMARIYEKRQRYEKAIQQYAALYRELGISQPGLNYHLEEARLHEIIGNETMAVNIYKEINQIDPGSEAAARARTRMEALNLLQKTGDYGKTKETADTVVNPPAEPK